MTARRGLLAGTTALALLLGGLLVAQPWDGGSGEERLLVGDKGSGITDQTPTLPAPPSPTATTPAPQPKTAAVQLPPWLRVELPRPSAQPACPRTSRMPAPSGTGQLPDRGSEVFSLTSDGSTALVGLFPDEPRLRDNAYVQALDLSTGALTNRVETPGAQVLETTPQRMWALSSPDDEGVMAIDVRSGKTVRHWSASVLADPDNDRASPVAIAVSQETTFVLSFGEDVSLAALDPEERQPRWVKPLAMTGPSAYSSSPNMHLTAHAGEAYVAVEDQRLPGVRVMRVDAGGRVRARTAIVMPGLVMEPTLVAGPDGVYLTMTFDGLQKNVGSAYLLRLDRGTLVLGAKRLLAGYAEPGRIGMGLWTETIACGGHLLSTYDPVTLAVQRTYDVHPESTEATYFDFSSTGLIIAFKREFEDHEVIVERYKGL